MIETIYHENTGRYEQRVITLEQYQKIRERRRRRVAKRLVKVVPLFVVEEMQKEFPGYTYDQFVQDVTRKTRKSKSHRKPKRKSFDWGHLKKEIPDFFEKCIERTPSKAKLRLKVQAGEFLITVKKVYDNEMCQCYMQEYELIKLWRGTLKAFLNHPAVGLQKMMENKIEYGA